MNNDFSPTQIKVLRLMAKQQTPIQIAGYGAAPLISSARSLLKRGLVREGRFSGWYGLTDLGRIAVINLEE